MRSNLMVAVVLLTAPTADSVFHQADEAKMKDLSLQLEKMLAALQKKYAELEDEVTETQAAQIELDKTAEDFRNLHRCFPPRHPGFRADRVY